MSVFDDRTGVEAVARFLKPRSVAIVGVSSRPHTAGRTILESLAINQFDGDVHLVGRSGQPIDGRPMLRSIGELPRRVDLAVLALPAAGVKEAIDACVERQVRSALVFAAGFAEIGDLRGQEEVAEAARRGGLALVGPNCIGYTNNVDGLMVHMIVARPARRWHEGEKPGVALVGQSGGLMNHLQRGAEGRGLPLAYVVNTGNEAGLDVADFVGFFAEDPATRVIALYCEQVRRPRHFLEAVGRARSAGKSVVVVHPGRSAKAKTAARSHTGSVVGNHPLMATVMEDAGALVLGTLDEFLDVIELLERFPNPSPRGPALLTNSGAFVALAQDMAEDMQLQFPALTPNTIEYCRRLLPDFAITGNPLDTTAAVSPEALGESARALIKDPGVGILLTCISLSSPEHLFEVNRRLRDVDEPAVLVIFGDTFAYPPDIVQAAVDGPAVFWHSADRALRAVHHYGRYGKLLARERGEAPLRYSALPHLGRGPQPEWVGKEVLKAIGLRVPEGELARTQDEAVKVAARIGYPVALKVQSATISHKSAVGGVALDLADEASLRRAWRTMPDRLRGAGVGEEEVEGALVERMADSGVELMVGAMRDPDWGPVLVVGLGGTWLEALGDVRLLPIGATADDVIDALGRLRSRRLLEGFLGAPPADVGAVAEAATRIARLMVTVPEIAEIEVNPLVVHRDGQGASALDALIVTTDELTA